MSDHEHTDETGKTPEENVELDLSGLTESPDTDFQTLLDEAVLKEDEAAEVEPESLSEPDLDALVEGAGEASEPLDFMLHDTTEAGEAPAADMPEPAESGDIEPPSVAEDDSPDPIGETGPEDVAEEPVASDSPSPEAGDPADDEAVLEPPFWDEEESESLSEDDDVSPSAEESGDEEEADEDEDDVAEPEEDAQTAWLDDVAQEAVTAPEHPDHGGNGDGPATPEKKSGSKLPVLLGLLAVIAGAAFYFTSGTPEQPPVPPHKSVPVQPEPQAMQETEPAEAPAVAEPQQAAPAAVEEESTPAVITPQTPENGTAMSSEPASEPAAQAETVPAVSEAMAVTGPYTLQGGVFVFRSHLKRAEARVKKLGFDPRVSDEKKELNMTRLRVGEFPAEVAPGKLQQVKALAPHGAFTMKAGDQIAVYAGSYYSAAAAQRAAKQLAARGLTVQQESAKVMMPVHVLYFGSFADHAAAAAKLAEVKAAGVSAFVKKLGAAGGH